MMAEAHLVHLPLLPLERRGGLVVHVDEAVDGTPDLARRGVAGPDQRTAAEDGEPDLDLVEPARVGRGEVEVDIPMAGQPAIVAGLVGVEVVEDDVDLQVRIGMGREDLVHEVEELAPPAARVVAGLDLPCLLYTSDAADDLLCVDLGGRRIIKKKKTK